MSIQHEYETTYLLKPELPDDALKAIQDKITGIITNNGGSVLLMDDWGKRKLAYPIQKNSRGHYFNLSFVSLPGLITELERHLRIDDNLLRFLTVKVGDDVNVALRQSEAAEIQAVREAERAAREAEEAQRAAAEEAAAAAAAAAAPAASIAPEYAAAEPAPTPEGGAK